MKTWVFLVTAMLLLITTLAGPASAEVVGRITQVEGRVDLLKGGQLPANPVKLEDPVSLGDVLRTKSLSKANITFADNTVITISPESRIAIEQYMFDPSKGKRSAVLTLFQGMALAVVSKIFKTEQPDFVIKTHTAIMGVRGTEIGVRLTPNDSTFLNFVGLTRVASIFPEVCGDFFRKAGKVAYSFDKGYVDLGNMQATTVMRGLTPTVPQSITKEDRDMFLRQLVVGGLGPQSGGRSATATCNPSSGDKSSNVPSDLDSANDKQSILVHAPLSPPPRPSLDSLSFTQSPSNVTGFLSASGRNATTATFNINSFSFSSGTQNITLANTGLAATITSNNSNSSLFWNNVNNIQLTYIPFNISANLSGQSGSPLSGTINLTLSANTFNRITQTYTVYQTFNLQGTGTYANGTLTLTNLSGTFTTAGGPPSGTVTLGTYAQPIPVLALTAAASSAGPRLLRTQLAGTRMGAQRITLLHR